MAGATYYPDFDILKTCLSGWKRLRYLKVFFKLLTLLFRNVGEIDSNSWKFQAGIMKMNPELECKLKGVAWERDPSRNENNTEK